MAAIRRRNATTQADVRTHVAALRLVAVSALVFGVIGCHPPNKKGEGLASPWTSYNPLDDKPTFIAQIKHLSFPAPDSPQDSQPRIAGDKHVYVDINPEESVASTFDPGNPGQPAFGNATFASDGGRIMAMFRLRDVETDFDILKLDRQSKHSVYAIWWVETKGNTDWHAWKSHYYRVNQDSLTVVELDNTPLAGTFVFHPEKDYIFPNAPRLADWNKHPFPVVFAPAPAPTNIKKFNSSWVSCGGGCCNGQ